MLAVDRKYCLTAEYIEYLCLVDRENVIHQMDYKKMTCILLYILVYSCILLYTLVTLYEHTKVVACCKKVSPHNQNW